MYSGRVYKILFYLIIMTYTTEHKAL